MNVRKYFKDPRLIVMSRYYFDQHVLINGNIVQHLKREGKKKESDREKMPPVAGCT